MSLVLTITDSEDGIGLFAFTGRVHDVLLYICEDPVPAPSLSLLLCLFQLNLPKLLICLRIRESFSWHRTAVLT